MRTQLNPMQWRVTRFERVLKKKRACQYSGADVSVLVHDYKVRYIQQRSLRSSEVSETYGTRKNPISLYIEEIPTECRIPGSV